MRAGKAARRARAPPRLVAREPVLAERAEVRELGEANRDPAADRLGRGEDGLRMARRRTAWNTAERSGIAWWLPRAARRAGGVQPQVAQAESVCCWALSSFAEGKRNEPSSL